MMIRLPVVADGAIPEQQPEDVAGAMRWVKRN